MRKLFGSDKAAWRAFVDMFWRIAKRSDLLSCADFEAEFADLTALARATTCCDEKTRELAFEWLAALGERREQWAARFTWKHLTLDVHSTQRAEAIHSALQHIISSSDKINKL
mmetsp:Transcript_35397/g.88112  ORF Transcript_35397/g.88112 Transcript_35397/m.88112 type:complete len:113 (+) Transcript_35397:274-612(+)